MPKTIARRQRGFGEQLKAARMELFGEKFWRYKLMPKPIREAAAKEDSSDLMAWDTYHQNEEDRKRLDEALEYAVEKHFDVKRKSGKWYVTHPAAVARRMLLLERSTDEIIASLLHDVVEDTKTSVKEIRKRFGERVAYLVQHLSAPKFKLVKGGLKAVYADSSRYHLIKDRSDNLKEAAKTDLDAKEKFDELYNNSKVEHYGRLAAEDDDGLNLIKYFDVFHNTRDVLALDENQRERNRLNSKIFTIMMRLQLEKQGDELKSVLTLPGGNDFGGVFVSSLPLRDLFARVPSVIPSLSGNVIIAKHRKYPDSVHVAIPRSSSKLNVEFKRAFKGMRRNSITRLQALGTHQIYRLRLPAGRNYDRWIEEVSRNVAGLYREFAKTSSQRAKT